MARPKVGIADGLFRRRALLDRRCFDVGLFTLLIGFVQELVDDASALLLLDPSLLRFPLFGEELVVAQRHWKNGREDRRSAGGHRRQSYVRWLSL